MKNKILFITPGYMPIKNKKGGGIESLLDIYFSHNSKTGNYEITAYSAYDNNDKPDADENYRHVQFRNVDISKRNDKISHKVARAFQVAFGVPCARYYIKEVLKDLKLRDEEDVFDLIVVENCENDLAYIGKNLKTKTPIVLHLHNDYIHKDRKDAKAATNFLTQVWGVSNFIRDRVNDINPKENKAITVYNAVNLNKLAKNATEKEKEELRKMYDIKKSDYVFLYVGRIMKEKGVLELMEAFRRLETKHSNIKLLIVGGKKNDNKYDFYFHKIKHIARSDANIKMCGRINNLELNKYYQISNCQIIPSKCNEAFGLVALEGMLNGLTIISSRNGGLPEVFDGNNPPFYVEQVTPVTLQRAMRNALDAKSPKKEEKYAVAFSASQYCKDLDNAILKLRRKYGEKE